MQEEEVALQVWIQQGEQKGTICQAYVEWLSESERQQTAAGEGQLDRLTHWCARRRKDDWLFDILSRSPAAGTIGQLRGASAHELP